MTKQEFAQWLEDSERIKLTKFSHEGTLVCDVGWRFHFEVTKYGTKCINELTEQFYTLNSNIRDCFTNGSQAWSVHVSCVLVYTRI